MCPQAGGEVRELQAAADKLSVRLAKDTAAAKNKHESVATERATVQQVCFLQAVGVLFLCECS